uniref:Putative secreted protein n=1 Tax=Anopheles darlingi TaxID=43151 RepID=A0A2M4DHB0_ANODA
MGRRAVVPRSRPAICRPRLVRLMLFLSLIRGEPRSKENERSEHIDQLAPPPTGYAISEVVCRWRRRPRIQTRLRHHVWLGYWSNDCWLLT